jgi:hypothetical protein
MDEQKHPEPHCRRIHTARYRHSPEHVHIAKRAFGVTRHVTSFVVITEHASLIWAST